LGGYRGSWVGCLTEVDGGGEGKENVPAKGRRILMVCPLSVSLWLWWCGLVGWLLGWELKRKIPDGDEGGC
jgi:hypothetical protein